MLKGDLYTIKKISEANKTIEAIIDLNEQHEIYKGHFPNQPILPGVCMMQMVKEILESFLGQKLQLVKADDIRFLVMIDPTVYKELKFALQYNFNEAQQISVHAKILDTKDVSCCRMKATYKS